MWIRGKDDTPMVTMYATNESDVIIPDVTFGSRWLHPGYLAYIECLAKYASEHGGRLKVATPYSAWARYEMLRRQNQKQKD